MNIRRCTEQDFPELLVVINDGAQAYKGVIPADSWHEPYFPKDYLEAEIAAGVRFWGCEIDGELAGVMGIQDRGEVNLIRHAYVRSAHQRRGIGGRLLECLQGLDSRPILIGTWAAATWAIAFYRRHHYRLLAPKEAEALLRKYWTVSQRQSEISVVLASPRWRA